MKLKWLFSVLNSLSGIACLVIGTVLVLDLGFHLSVENKALFSLLHRSLFYYYLVDVALRLLIKPRISYFLWRPTDIMVLFPFIVSFLPTGSFFTPFFMEQLALLLIMLGRILHVTNLFKLLKFQPTQMLLIGFVYAIFMGSIVLSLPISSYAYPNISFVDALFTATSAICVTGLNTLDISKVFTPFGQAVILILIQIGGLGIMSFSALFAIFMNRRLSQRESQEFQESFSVKNSREMFQLIIAIFKITFFVELLGAVLLFLFWHRDFDSVGDAIFSSIFHSVSAFCNAGFSLFPDSFSGYVTDYPIILIVSMLVIVGGIGFPVIVNLRRYFEREIVHSRLKLQTKFTLWVTGILLVVGTLIILSGEYSRALASYSTAEKVLVSFFHSVSARTAGFNSVDLGSFQLSTLMIVMFLMFIGASPGSTGGGVKTTAFGLVVLSFWNTLRSNTKLELWGRTIPFDNVRKALSVMILSALVVCVFAYSVLWFEPVGFMPGLFETVSAFSTTGLSLGITSDLSLVGKGFIMVLMFIGRLGPLTVAFALARRKSEANYRLPEERIMTG